jgi:6-phosphogluconate dehydrogenase
MEKMMKHDIGVAGLAVMGENLVLNISSKGYAVAVFNRTYEKTRKFLDGRARDKEITGFEDVADFVQSLESPRKILMMLKAGEPVDQFIDQLLPHLDAGDILIDGGNSHYLDTERRKKYLEEKNLLFIGTGVSGGEEGALKGPSIMPGGSEAAWPYLRPIFLAASAKVDNDEPCCAWIGPGGAGHFVKMVHNGIEYGDMQLICETYHFMKSVLKMSGDEIQETFSRWNTGELSSYLIEITAEITGFRDDKGKILIDYILDAAGQKGTGKWTVNAALEHGVPLSLISESVFARCISSFKELRESAAQKIDGPSFVFEGDREQILIDLGSALYSAKILSYTQGFSLLKTASDENGWDLDFAKIASIWRGGCIIRSVFLDKISEAYTLNPDLENMLFDPHFNTQVSINQKSLRRVVATAVQAGIPLPCHAAGLHYFDALRTSRLPANLLQAQRDYFGAHMYERVDSPRGKWFHTNWTGEGGDTTSSAYSK